MQGSGLPKHPNFITAIPVFFHALARIRDREDLYAHPALGASWESYVIEQIYRCTGKSCEYYFYRTASGHEVDLVLITPRSEKICIEIKYSNAPNVARGFFSSLEDLKPVASYIITPEAEQYRRSDGTIVTNVYQFLTEELVELMR